MYAPRVRSGLHLSPSLTPFLVATAAVLATVAAWATFGARTTSNDAIYPIGGPISARSVAYSVPGLLSDTIYVRPLAGGEAREVRTFRYAYNLHLTGVASPTADRIAVLHIDNTDARARLAIVSIPSGETVDSESQFDYLSPLAWSPDGRFVAAVLTPDSGSRGVAVLQVDAWTGKAAAVAQFDAGVRAAPVGYSSDSKRLLIVVIDQGGSSLWVRSGDSLERLAYFSPGPTRAWSLSPDGSRLAFVERIGVGERSNAGRTLTIATGQVSAASAANDQLGAAWRPGSGVADFGGPGGSVRLTDPAPGEYIVPIAFAPDGATLVAEVYAPHADDPASVDVTIELLSVGARTRLSEFDGARFLGFVRDSD